MPQLGLLRWARGLRPPRLRMRRSAHSRGAPERSLPDPQRNACWRDRSMRPSRTCFLWWARRWSTLCQPRASWRAIGPVPRRNHRCRIRIARSSAPRTPKQYWTRVQCYLGAGGPLQHCRISAPSGPCPRDRSGSNRTWRYRNGPPRPTRRRALRGAMRLSWLFENLHSRHASSVARVRVVSWDSALRWIREQEMPVPQVPAQGMPSRWAPAREIT